MTVYGIPERQIWVGLAVAELTFNACRSYARRVGFAARISALACTRTARNLRALAQTLVFKALRALNQRLWNVLVRKFAFPRLTAAELH